MDWPSDELSALPEGGGHDPGSIYPSMTDRRTDRGAMRRVAWEVLVRLHHARWTGPEFNIEVR